MIRGCAELPVWRLTVARLKKKDGGRQEARTPDLRVANTVQTFPQMTHRSRLLVSLVRSGSSAGTCVLMRRCAWARMTDGHRSGHAA